MRANKIRDKPHSLESNHAEESVKVGETTVRKEPLSKTVSS